MNDFLTGLHLQHFEHWLLRWFYVLGGLSGCVCIATGFIFFVEKRKKQHATRRRQRRALGRCAGRGHGHRHRGGDGGDAGRESGLLPIDLPHRGDWEQRAFWAAWLLTFVHAAWRSAPVLQARIAPAWREQCWAIVVLAVAAVLLNWATTGDHLAKTIGQGYWPVAGLDLSLLAAAALAALAARRLQRRERAGLAGAGTPADPTEPGTTPETARA